MDKAKRAQTAETPKQPSLGLKLRAPYLYPDRPAAVPPGSRAGRGRAARHACVAARRHVASARRPGKPTQRPLGCAGSFTAFRPVGALIGALRAENASLKARIAELERRLGLNSSNSGKPPSSDGLRRPVRVKSLREGSGKPRGGQKGHTGETLRQVTDPDDVADHYPSACSRCGAGLGPEASVGHSARQVFDLPKPQPLIVTEHRAHDCQCAACGAKTRAPFPDGVNAPVQYGVEIAAFVVYLLHYQLLPEDRLAELMADLFGVKLAAATIARMSRTCAERLRGFAETVRDLVAGAPVKHLDETGVTITALPVSATRKLAPVMPTSAAVPSRPGHIHQQGSTRASCSTAGKKAQPTDPGTDHLRLTSAAPPWPHRAHLKNSPLPHHPQGIAHRHLLHPLL